MPLYPVLAFLVAASLLAGARKPAGLLITGGVTLLVVINTMALSSRAAEATEQTVRDRMGIAEASEPGRALWTTMTPQDPFANFQRSHEERAVRQGLRVPVTVLIQPGFSSRSWPIAYANRVLTEWADGHRVWVTRRALADRPLPDWDWVERRSQEVQWSQVREFFSRLEVGAARGDRDGFAEIPLTSSNMRTMQAVAGGA